MIASPRRAADAPETSTVRLIGAGFGYGDGPEILRDVNLNLPAGSFHFLTGPSGAGKSTLLNLLTLATRPTTGRIELFGRDAADLDRDARAGMRRRIGAVFQDFRLLDHLSVFDNVALPLRLAGRTPSDYAQDVGEMLAWVGLAGRAADRPERLSGGEKQRLAIARAVVGRPELIVADEPTGSVDAVMGERLMKLFLSLNRLGVTVVVATHDAELAARAGKPVLFLDDGVISGGAA